MALMKVKGNLERLFDKNLNDLVRGIRNHKDDEAKYIASCLEEIKQELGPEIIAFADKIVNYFSTEYFNETNNIYLHSLHFNIY